MDHRMGQHSDHHANDRPPVFWQNIGPDRARYLLSVEGPQRNLRSAVVASMQLDMREGRWGNCYDPIVIDSEQHCINGQHRLHAIIQSNTSQWFTIVDGVPTDAIFDMDKGTSRKVVDDLKIMGIPNRSAIAAVSRLVLAYDQHPGSVWGGSSFASKAAIRDDIELHSDAYQSSVAPRPLGAPVSAVRYLIGRDTELGDRFAVEFLAPIVDQVGLRVNQPQLAIRRYIDRPRRLHDRAAPPQFVMMMWIRAWNLYLRGKSLQVARMPSGKNLPMTKPDASGFKSVQSG